MSTAAPAGTPRVACAAYRRVAEAIRLLRTGGPAAADLRTLAARLHTRPGTLQRQFSAWAGLSPKRFALALAAARGRVSLAEGRDVLGAALDAGLSGPGRLHDVLVTVDACAPGDVGRRGAGLALHFGVGPSPFGEAFVATTARGVHRLAFVDDPADLSRAVEALRRTWPRATFTRDDGVAAEVLTRAFPATSRPRPLHLWVRGTNLHLAVWRALVALPPGARTTYADLAAVVAAPRAVRAVANAVAANPVAWVVPCHRVLRSDGALAGYAWGLDRKAAMLGWEAARGASLRPAP